MTRSAFVRFVAINSVIKVEQEHEG
jgi:hypothetical protein